MFFNPFHRAVYYSTTDLMVDIDASMWEYMKNHIIPGEALDMDS
jgi:hypothetical protein